MEGLIGFITAGVDGLNEGKLKNKGKRDGRGQQLDLNFKIGFLTKLGAICVPPFMLRINEAYK